MKLSTQTADELGLPIARFVRSYTYDSHVGGRGYDRRIAIDVAESEAAKQQDDSYILVNKTVSAYRTSHPRSDFGDYEVTIAGDLYLLNKPQEIVADPGPSPAVVSIEQMAAILEDMAMRVRAGDCFDGAIEFHLADDFNGAGLNEYSVMGSYRFGNLEGQGGMRLIQADAISATQPSDPEPRQS